MSFAVCKTHTDLFLSIFKFIIIMKKLFYILLIFITQISNIFSQKITLSGYVKNKNDSLPVPYVHIGNLQNGNGCISNLNGSFKFNCYPGDSVYISHISFKTIKFKIEDNQEKNFYLDKLKYNLCEIKITPKDSMRLWLSKAIKNLKKNSPKDIHYMQAFYRETQYNEKDRKYTRLIEAAIDIQDRNVTTNFNKIRCKINQLRKSNDFAHRTILNWINSKIFSENNNNIYNSIKADPIRSYFPFKRNNLKNCLSRITQNPNTELFFEGEYKKNNVNYVKISFKTKGFLKNIGNLIINKKDYAIVHLESKSIIDAFSSKHAGEKILVKYKKFKEHYYPMLIRYTKISDHRKSEQKGTDLGFSDNLIIFNKHYFNRSEFNKINKRFVLNKDKDLHKHIGKYDSTFWNHYNMLLLEPIEAKITDDLSKSKKLNQQFFKNSTN